MNYFSFRVEVSLTLSHCISKWWQQDSHLFLRMVGELVLEIVIRQTRGCDLIRQLMEYAEIFYVSFSNEPFHINHLSYSCQFDVKRNKTEKFKI